MCASEHETIAWSECPGCGVMLPDAPGASGSGIGPDGPDARRRNVSAACWQLYGEVTGYQLSHLELLGRHHQMTVDAYGAQHAGGGTPRIGVAFALIGLHLAFDEGMDGLSVRDAHQYLAGHWRDWPPFAPPSLRADLTVEDVALAGSPDEHASLVRRWAAAVWASWRDAHGAVRTLTDERLPSR